MTRDLPVAGPPGAEFRLFVVRPSLPLIQYTASIYASSCLQKPAQGHQGPCLGGSFARNQLLLERTRQAAARKLPAARKSTLFELHLAYQTLATDEISYPNTLLSWPGFKSSTRAFPGVRTLCLNENQHLPSPMDCSLSWQHQSGSRPCRRLLMPLHSPKRFSFRDIRRPCRKGQIPLPCLLIGGGLNWH